MTDEDIQRLRMHGLYLSRGCDDLVDLSRELLGLHCWFHRNVVFSALIRGADISGWKTRLTKTWLYRGTLHGVAEDDLPTLLALRPFTGYPQWLTDPCAEYGHAGSAVGDAPSDRANDCAGDCSNDRAKGVAEEIADEVMRLMGDGVFSRAEMRRIFSDRYDEEIIRRVFSSWGGIFVSLAMQGRVAFRDMASRDFDLIDAEPTRSQDDVLPELFRRYIKAYGPATLDDAAWFFGFLRQDKKQLKALDLSEYGSFRSNGRVYYHASGIGASACADAEGAVIADIPKLTLLSGFDPIIVSYVERGAVLPPEYKKRVVLSSGICLPTVAVDGRVAGLWNIKGGKPTVEFFETQPAQVASAAYDLVEEMRWRSAGRI